MAPVPNSTLRVRGASPPAEGLSQQRIGGCSRSVHELCGLRGVAYRTTMGRPLRVAPGGLVYHVLNRANGQQALFDDEGDYAAFERVLSEAQERIAMRLLSYCVMPNHWHLVLWP